MKKMPVVGILLAAAMVCALQLNCVFTVPPPPPPQEAIIAPAPYPDAVWVRGYWQWGRWHHHYKWVPGHWKIRRHGVWVIIH